MRAPLPTAGLRPRVRGKFLYLGSEKLYIRGVTYGAFRPDKEGREYTDFAQIDRDFAQMAASGFNAVRIPHTTPPRAVLDIAHRHGLWVMVGLSCEQYVGYLIDRHKAPDIRSEVRSKVRSSAGHPALLCYALGNEVPASIARWLGGKRINRYLQQLYRVVKSEDPEGIVTYVNYPTTEYLRLSFLDMLAFNVYLEDQGRFAAYLARLHHLAGDRPLLMSEIGLDSLRNGEHEQARWLESHVQTTFEAGCAGAFVFSWTDDWFRGGEDIDDWAFGLTDRERRPKPALQAVSDACQELPLKRNAGPRVSVVVCAFNAGATIGDTLEGCAELAYPDYDVIVVNDGSTDDTESIARRFDCRLITTPNRGLSAARNTGLWEATGEIVAYVDADARPDPHWLQYLVASFDDRDFAAIGGPNIAPPEDGEVAECISNAPGNPTHVMLDDRVAEHIPGCNMAFRRDVLLALGGFDPRFRVAGDDVDICWRIQDAGGTIGFSPAAVVWHHRRGSVRAFWRQQVGYGAAEGRLHRKWRDRHNDAGRIRWSGQIYGSGRLTWPRRRAHVYQGPWGTAPFQSIYQPRAGSLASVLASAEWRLMVVGLVMIGALGLAWGPLLSALPLAIAGAAAMMAQASAEAARGSYSRPSRSLRLLTAALFVLQPLARLHGRMRARGKSRSLNVARVARGVPLLPRRVTARWSKVWRDPVAWLTDMRQELQDAGADVRLGSDYDGWDLYVRGGRFGGARLLAAFEDAASRSQSLRFRIWAFPARTACFASILPLLIAAGLGLAGSNALCALFAAAGALSSATVGLQCAVALRRLWEVVPEDGRTSKREAPS